MEYKAEKKLRSLAKKLEGLIHGNTPKLVYDGLVDVMVSQKDYTNSLYFMSKNPFTKIFIFS